MTGRGIVRRLDELGRATLPKEFRRSLSLGDRARIEICLEQDHLAIYPADRAPTACCSCGRTDKLREHGGITLCERCLQGFFDKK